MQIVQLVRVSLLAEDSRAVVVRECQLDAVRVIHEVEDKHVVLLGMSAVEPGKRLHRLDAGQPLIDVHRVHQRLVVAGLKLVGADQQAIGVLADLVDDLVAWKAVERRLRYLGALVVVFSREGHDRPIRALPLLEISLDGVEILDCALDASGSHHRACLPADLLKAKHMVVEVVHHDFGL